MLLMIREFLNIGDRLKRDEGGLAFIEFGFLLPLLIIIFYAIVELTRYVLMNQKLDNASHTVTDVVNQSLVPSCAAIQTLIDAVPVMLRPYYNSDNPVDVVVTSIGVPEGSLQPEINWQYPEGSTISIYPSAKGSPVSLPDLMLLSRQQVLAVEVKMDYKPIMDNGFIRDTLGIEDRGVYKRILARPRYGAFNFPPC
ncbi:MAG: pilus assembly protein [Rickettsiales bacterium]|nr:pilus assembly protein [Rickettsiales bacterium]